MFDEGAGKGRGSEQGVCVWRCLECAVPPFDRPGGPRSEWVSGRAAGPALRTRLYREHKTLPNGVVVAVEGGGIAPHMPPTPPPPIQGEGEGQELQSTVRVTHTITELSWQ